MSEIEDLKKNITEWIKQIRHEFEKFSDIPGRVIENTDSIQHNYELIYELQDQIEELKQEVNTMKLLQVSMLEKLNIRERKEVRSRIN